MSIRFVALVVCAVAICACGGNGQGDGETLEGTPKPTPDLTLAPVVAARADLAERLGLKLEDVEVISVSAQQWSDTCLGVMYADRDEACAQVITPGYEIVLGLAEGRYAYRTDKAGSIVRIAGLDLSPD